MKMNPNELKPQELEMVKLMADGAQSKEIAVKLKYSLNSVDTMRYRLMKRLNVLTTGHLISYCYQKGILTITGFTVPCWYVKNYADGWIQFHNVSIALRYAIDTGAVMKWSSDGMPPKVI